MGKAYTNRSVDKLRRSFIVFLPTKNTKYEKTPKARAEARKKAQFKGGIRVFQHADDLTQMMWAKSEAELADRGYNSVRIWAQEVRMALRMQCSDKNVIIPEGVPASIVQRALFEEGVKVDIMIHGVDVGIDVTAGKRRATQKLKEREQHGRKKANRVSVLARIDEKVQGHGQSRCNAHQHIRKQCGRSR